MGHGKKGTLAYNSWSLMRDRCNNFNNLNYLDYGGRGITVCTRWDSFLNFLEDMGERPEDSTIDRIDSDGNYEPDNCRWATRKEQTRNRRMTVTVTYAGDTRPLAEWAEMMEVSYSTLNWRRQAGWCDQDIIEGKGRRTC